MKPPKRSLDLDIQLTHCLHGVEGDALEAPPTDREYEGIVVLQDLLVPPVLLDSHLRRRRRFENHS